MFILDSNRYARDPAAAAAEIPKMIESCGGKMLASRLWNEQRLAYPIRGQRKGAYWLSYFRMDTDKVVDFNRACQLNDLVLRNLTLKVEPRLVDTLVAHARGEAPPQSADSQAADEVAGDADKATADSQAADEVAGDADKATAESGPEHPPEQGDQ
jgi:small subunit ribosomal protein S6